MFSANLLKHNVKIILVGANIPITPSADQYLVNINILIIPDFLARAGNVIGIFVEYHGRIEKEAFDLIEYKLQIILKGYFTTHFHQRVKEMTLDVRKFEMETAKQIVYRVMQLRKDASSVSREAYARKERTIYQAD